MSVVVNTIHESRRKLPLIHCHWVKWEDDVSKKGEEVGGDVALWVGSSPSDGFHRIFTDLLRGPSNGSKLEGKFEKYANAASCVGVSPSGRYLVVAGIRPKKGGFVVAYCKKSSTFVKIHKDPTPKKPPLPNRLLLGKDLQRPPRHVGISDDGGTVILITFQCQLFMFQKTANGDVWFHLRSPTTDIPTEPISATSPLSAASPRSGVGASASPSVSTSLPITSDRTLSVCSNFTQSDLTRGRSCRVAIVRTAYRHFAGPSRSSDHPNFLKYRIDSMCGDLSSGSDGGAGKTSSSVDHLFEPETEAHSACSHVLLVDVCDVGFNERKEDGSSATLQTAAATSSSPDHFNAQYQIHDATEGCPPSFLVSGRPGCDSRLFKCISTTSVVLLNGANPPTAGTPQDSSRPSIQVVSCLDPQGIMLAVAVDQPVPRVLLLLLPRGGHLHPPLMRAIELSSAAQPSPGVSDLKWSADGERLFVLATSGHIAMFTRTGLPFIPVQPGRSSVNAAFLPQGNLTSANNSTTPSYAWKVAPHLSQPSLWATCSGYAIATCESQEDAIKPTSSSDDHPDGESPNDLLLYFKRRVLECYWDICVNVCQHHHRQSILHNGVPESSVLFRLGTLALPLIDTLLGQHTKDQTMETFLERFQFLCSLFLWAEKAVHEALGTTANITTASKIEPAWVRLGTLTSIQLQGETSSNNPSEATLQKGLAFVKQQLQAPSLALSCSKMSGLNERAANTQPSSVEGEGHAHFLKGNLAAALQKYIEALPKSSLMVMVTQLVLGNVEGAVQLAVSQLLLTQFGPDGHRKARLADGDAVLVGPSLPAVEWFVHHPSLSTVIGFPAVVRCLTDAIVFNVVQQQQQSPEHRGLILSPMFCDRVGGQDDSCNVIVSTSSFSKEMQTSAKHFVELPVELLRKALSKLPIRLPAAIRAALPNQFLVQFSVHLAVDFLLCSHRYIEALHLCISQRLHCRADAIVCLLGRFYNSNRGKVSVRFCCGAHLKFETGSPADQYPSDLDALIQSVGRCWSTSLAKWDNLKSPQCCPICLHAVLTHFVEHRAAGLGRAASPKQTTAASAAPLHSADNETPDEETKEDGDGLSNAMQLISLADHSSLPSLSLRQTVANQLVAQIRDQLSRIPPLTLVTESPSPLKNTSLSDSPQDVLTAMVQLLFTQPRQTLVSRLKNDATNPLRNSTTLTDCMKAFASRDHKGGDEDWASPAVVQSISNILSDAIRAIGATLQAICVGPKDKSGRSSTSSMPLLQALYRRYVELHGRSFQEQSAAAAEMKAIHDEGLLSWLEALMPGFRQLCQLLWLVFVRLKIESYLAATNSRSESSGLDGAAQHSNGGGGGVFGAASMPQEEAQTIKKTKKASGKETEERPESEELVSSSDDENEADSKGKGRKMLLSAHLLTKAAQWAVHLLPFADEIYPKAVLHDAVLTVLWRVPTSAVLAHLLGTHFDLDDTVSSCKSKRMRIEKRMVKDDPSLNGKLEELARRRRAERAVEEKEEEEATANERKPSEEIFPSEKHHKYWKFLDCLFFPDHKGATPSEWPAFVQSPLVADVGPTLSKTFGSSYGWSECVPKMSSQSQSLPLVVLLPALSLLPHALPELRMASQLLSSLSNDLEETLSEATTSSNDKKKTKKKKKSTKKDRHKTGQKSSSDDDGSGGGGHIPKNQTDDNVDPSSNQGSEEPRCTDGHNCPGGNLSQPPTQMPALLPSSESPRPSPGNDDEPAAHSRRCRSRSESPPIRRLTISPFSSHMSETTGSRAGEIEPCPPLPPTLVDTSSSSFPTSTAGIRLLTVSRETLPTDTASPGFCPPNQRSNSVPLNLQKTGHEDLVSVASSPTLDLGEVLPEPQPQMCAHRCHKHRQHYGHHHHHHRSSDSRHHCCHRDGAAHSPVRSHRCHHIHCPHQHDHHCHGHRYPSNSAEQHLEEVTSPHPQRHCPGRTAPGASMAEAWKSTEQGNENTTKKGEVRLLTVPGTAVRKHSRERYTEATASPDDSNASLAEEDAHPPTVHLVPVNHPEIRLPMAPTPGPACLPTQMPSALSAPSRQLITTRSLPNTHQLQDATPNTPPEPSEPKSTRRTRMLSIPERTNEPEPTFSKSHRASCQLLRLPTRRGDATQPCAESQTSASTPSHQTNSASSAASASASPAIAAGPLNGFASPSIPTSGRSGRQSPSSPPAPVSLFTVSHAQATPLVPSNSIRKPPPARVEQQPTSTEQPTSAWDVLRHLTDVVKALPEATAAAAAATLHAHGVAAANRSSEASHQHHSSSSGRGINACTYTEPPLYSGPNIGSAVLSQALERQYAQYIQNYGITNYDVHPADCIPTHDRDQQTDEKAQSAPPQQNQQTANAPTVAAGAQSAASAPLPSSLFVDAERQLKELMAQQAALQEMHRQQLEMQMKHHQQRQLGEIASVPTIAQPPPAASSSSSSSSTEATSAQSTTAVLRTYPQHELSDAEYIAYIAGLRKACDEENKRNQAMAAQSQQPLSKPCVSDKNVGESVTTAEADHIVTTGTVEQSSVNLHQPQAASAVTESVAIPSQGSAARRQEAESHDREYIAVSDLSRGKLPQQLLQYTLDKETFHTPSTKLSAVERALLNLEEGLAKTSSDASRVEELLRENVTQFAQRTSFPLHATDNSAEGGKYRRRSTKPLDMLEADAERVEQQLSKFQTTRTFPTSSSAGHGASTSTTVIPFDVAQLLTAAADALPPSIAAASSSSLPVRVASHELTSQSYALSGNNNNSGSLRIGAGASSSQRKNRTEQAPLYDIVESSEESLQEHQVNQRIHQHQRSSQVTLSSFPEAHIVSRYDNLDTSDLMPQRVSGCGPHSPDADALLRMMDAALGGKVDPAGGRSNSGIMGAHDNAVASGPHPHLPRRLSSRSPPPPALHHLEAAAKASGASATKHEALKRPVDPRFAMYAERPFSLPNASRKKSKSPEGTARRNTAEQQAGAGVEAARDHPTTAAPQCTDRFHQKLHRKQAELSSNHFQHRLQRMEELVKPTTTMM